MRESFPIGWRICFAPFAPFYFHHGGVFLHLFSIKVYGNRMKGKTFPLDFRFHWLTGNIFIN